MTLHLPSPAATTVASRRLLVRRLLVGSVAACLFALPGIHAIAQSPSAGAAPSPFPCPAMSVARHPLHDPGAVMSQGFGVPNPAFPGTDPASPGRVHPGEDWSYPGDPAGVLVHPIGDGRIIASGPIATGDRGDIVVVEHAGPFILPASVVGAPYVYPALAADTVLSVYQGIDATPDLAVGYCVNADSIIGVTTAQCRAGVAPPCTGLPSALHLELRLASTADPSVHSSDWSTVGPASDSSDGYYFDAAVMVADGLREPASFIASLAVSCPAAEDPPDPSATPCVVASPLPSATPEPTPTPTPTPTPKPTRRPTPEPTRRPLTDAAAVVRAGVPASIRKTCVRRTSGLVTGTIAALDCTPASGRIRLISYYLLRPDDARFVFASRMRQYDAQTGADCQAGVPGIESKGARLSSGCFVDDQGRANLRFVSRASCPAIYVGVLGTGRDIAGLAEAYDSVVGDMWQDPGSRLKACRDGSTGVSPPPAPTDVEFKVHYGDFDGTEMPDYRLEVTWDEAVEADTTIEVYGVMTCPRSPVEGGRPCLTSRTRLPRSILKLQASAPAADGTVSWTVPGWEIIGGAVGWDKRTKYVYGIVVRAVNANGASRYVIAKNGNGWSCSDCMY